MQTSNSLRSLIAAGMIALGVGPTAVAQNRPASDCLDCVPSRSITVTRDVAEPTVGQGAAYSAIDTNNDGVIQENEITSFKGDMKVPVHGEERAQQFGTDENGAPLYWGKATVIDNGKNVNEFVAEEGLAVFVPPVGHSFRTAGNLSHIDLQQTIMYVDGTPYTAFTVEIAAVHRALQRSDTTPAGEGDFQITVPFNDGTYCFPVVAHFIGPRQINEYETTINFLPPQDNPLPPFSFNFPKMPVELLSKPKNYRVLASAGPTWRLGYGGKAECVEEGVCIRDLEDRTVGATGSVDARSPRFAANARATYLSGEAGGVNSQGGVSDLTEFSTSIQALANLYQQAGVGVIVDARLQSFGPQSDVDQSSYASVVSGPSFTMPWSKDNPDNDFRAIVGGGLAHSQSGDQSAWGPALGASLEVSRQVADIIFRAGAQGTTAFYEDRESPVLMGRASAEILYSFSDNLRVGGGVQAGGTRSAGTECEYVGASVMPFGTLELKF